MRTGTKWVAAGVVVLLAAGGAAGWQVSRHHGHPARAAAAAATPRPAPPSQDPAPTPTPSPTPTGPATFTGPAGVESRAVLAENARPGTTAWRIAGRGGGIDGFADRVSATAGDHVSLYVASAAATFHVDAYRMGWYGGAGARLVWSSPAVTTRRQPPCRTDSTVRMTSCDRWKPELDVTVDGSWPPGDYLLELVANPGRRSYIPLTVTDPDNRATYLVKNDVFTWQAWNPYGGSDFYQGVGDCPPDVYPLCTRARIVSFDRPYGYGQGAADFLSNEYPLVRFAEQHGLDVDYATDVDIQDRPGLVRGHKALLSLGHDECWSYRERLAAYDAERRGVNVAFFAASPMLRHVRTQASPLGPDRQEVDYRDETADPLDGRGNPLEVTGNTWSAPPASWSEVPFVGEAYAGYVEPGLTPAPFVVGPSSSWLYRGTGLRTGQLVPGALGSDFDAVQPGGHPSNLEVLAHSPIPRQEAQTEQAAPYSDTTYWTDPNGGAGIFDSGTNSWIPDLATCSARDGCPARAFGQMTGNLLALLGTGPAGRTRRSQPTWQRYYS